MQNFNFPILIGQDGGVGDAANRVGDSVAGATSGAASFFSGITDSMAPMLGEFFPKLIGAVIILVVGYFLAKFIRWGISSLLRKTSLGPKIGKYLGSATGPNDVADGVGTGAFWLTMLFVAIACLRALDLDQVSEPLMSLLNEFFAFLPNLIGAAALFAVAWLVATIAKFATLKALTVGKVDERLKLQEGTLTNSLPMAAFCFILLFFLPGVLGALQIDSLSGPVTEMVDKILDFIPNLISALIVLGIFYFIANLASTLITNLCEGVGFNNVPKALGLMSDTSSMQMSPSEIAGKASFVIILLMGISQAVTNLRLDMLSSFLEEAWAFTVPIIVGCVILGVGLWLSNIARKAIQGSNLANADTVANIAFTAIMVLTGVIALKRMGLAGEIVDLGFGLTLGAVALATALAFGLGGRNAAAKYLEQKMK